MSYQVLARKWRPQNFAEMAGQNHILRALIHALDNNQLHHAYLFTGTRGVGKTTIARILAKCLNCETGITSNPCGTCSSCIDIREGKFVDLIEVDAASRTKVEQTRDLLENIAYAPTRGRFKIYIIDEVHMLSTSSFNALLKTLEEPPAHVKFFLATTDPERLPMTVLSRCLRFHLKNMPADIISTRLNEILTKENITFTPDALDLLAIAAQGSMRDSLSLLDQAIAYGGGQVNAPDVRELLGHIDPHIMTHILQALKEQHGDALLSIVADCNKQGADPIKVLDELIDTLHQIAVLQIVPTASSRSDLQTFANYFSPQDIQLFYQIAVNGRRDIAWIANTRLGLEMILLRLLAFIPKENTQEMPKVIPAITVTEKKPTVVATPNTQSTWPHIVPNLKLTGLSLALASHCVLKSQQDGLWQLALAPQHAPLLNVSSANRIEQALSEHLNQKVRIRIDLEEVAEETLASKQSREQQQAQQLAVEAIGADKQVQAMVERLGASIVSDSITTR